MAKYELSIKASYLSNWGIYEGIRELIQNARDAEVQFNAPMTVKYAARKRNGATTGAIIIINEGVILPKEALLIGHTTKDGDNRLIGKFGEGLKFGILALLRLGVEIKIRNGSEVWVPSIERSEKYNADVLVFHVTSGHKLEQRVQFEVVGIDQSDWEDIEKKLLFISKYPESVECSSGHVLTAPSQRGNIYVKGMFVAHTGSHFGYDFNDADIDRDRRMINELSDKTSTLLAQAVNQGHLASQIFRLMNNGADEVSHLSTWRLDSGGRSAIAKEFQQENPGVIPVEQADQVKELESYGAKGRQVTWNLRGILESELGSASQKLQELRRSDKVRYDLGDLTQAERDVLRFVVSTVGRACQKRSEVVVPLAKVMVVDFYRDNQLGSYEPNTGTIRLARKLLSNKGNALYTMVHEVAHTHGGDGVKSHEDAIGSLMTEILNELL
jgi:hypothetical protein